MTNAFCYNICYSFHISRKGMAECKQRLSMSFMKLVLQYLTLVNVRAILASIPTSMQVFLLLPKEH